MEKKFTKGEWVMYKHAKSCVCADGGRIVANCGAYFNNIDYENVQTENDANARLIAQSPNLLDSLEKLMLSVKAHPDYISGSDGDEWHDLISLSQEVINKAL